MDFSPQFTPKNGFVAKVKDMKLTKTTLRTLGIFTLMFLCYFLIPTNIWANIMSVPPRTFDIGALWGIMGSWLSHGSATHLFGNITSMALPLWYFFYQTRDKSPWFWFFLMVFAQGLMTWLLSFSPVIGASGIGFALFGFVIASTFRSLFSFVFTLLTLFLFLTPMLSGLVPQETVSWAAHFGGLVAGWFIGRHFVKLNSTDAFYYKQGITDKIKQNWSDFKDKFKRKK